MDTSKQVTTLPVSTQRQALPNAQPQSDAAPVQLPEDVMLDIAYAAFRLHGGDEARTMWQINRPLAARLQPAAETQSLIQRQNNLAGRAVSPDRKKCFHDDLSQVGSLPAPLRACALAALGRSILHLPVAEQLLAFQGLISTLALLPECDRASTMAAWPMAMLLNNLGLPASHALLDFLKDPANWRGAEDLITVGMAHLNFRKTELLCEIADQIRQQAEPLVLFTILLQFADDPAFSDQTVLLEKLRCELPFCGKGPARLNWLYAAFSMMAARSETLDELGNGAVAELTALALYQPIAEVVHALTERHAGAGSEIFSALIAMQFTALLGLPLSSNRKTAWTTLLVAGFNLPPTEHGKMRVLELIARDLCKTVAAKERGQIFKQLIIHASSLEVAEIKVFVSDVVYLAAKGMREVEDDAQRAAAFECLYDVIRSIEPVHLVPSMRSLVQATSEYVPGKLKTLLDHVLSAEIGLTYSERASILGYIHLYKRYEGLDESRMNEILVTQLTAIEALGGHELGNMLHKFILQLSDCRVTTGMPTIVYRLEAAVRSLDKHASCRSFALSGLVRLCRHLPRQEQMCDLLQRVLMVEQGAVNHLIFIGDALKGILPAASASFEKWVVLAVFDAMLKTGMYMNVFEEIASLPENLTDSDKLEIALTVLRNIALVNRVDVYPLLSAVHTLVPDTMPADVFQTWKDAFANAPAESPDEVVRLLAFAGRIGAQMEETGSDQALGTLVSHAYAFKNGMLNIRPGGIWVDARQAGFWYNAARRLSLLKTSEQAGAFRFVLAAVNDARCPATFDERWLVLRKLWRVAGKLPSHLQGGATAALKQTLFERRLHSTPQEAARLRCETWDDLPHSEVQEGTYSPTIGTWRAQYVSFFG